jgi:hypothetical protein
VHARRERLLDSTQNGTPEIAGAAGNRDFLGRSGKRSECSQVSCSFN